MEKKWFVGQGSAAVDTLLYYTAPLEPDGLIEAEREVVTSGGSGANLVAAAAAMGVPSAMVAKIGDDAFGRQFREELVRSGVSDRYVVEQQGGTTLHTYIAVGPGGERSIIVAPDPCNSTLTIEELPADILDEAFLFFTDACPRKPALELARLAKKKGVPVFYQRESVDRSQEEEFLRMGRELLELADLVAGGADTYEQLVGTAEPAAALKAFCEKYHPKHGAIITAGKQGSYWFDGTELLYHPIFPVKSVDSTGAGDAFCGGLMAAYFMQGLSKWESLRFASACGAVKCTIPGPRLKCGRAEIEEFIRQHEAQGQAKGVCGVQTCGAQAVSVFEEVEK